MTERVAKAIELIEAEILIAEMQGFSGVVGRLTTIRDLLADKENPDA